jgi:Flp pilus assembly secretin CpaC
VVNTPAPVVEKRTPPLDQAVIDAGENPEHQLLAEKLAERDRVQKQIDELSKKLQASEHIYVELEMLEFNLSKMRTKGFEIECSGHDSSESNSHLLGMVEALRREGLARQLFSPTVATVSGRPASVFVGMQSPLPARDAIQAVEYVEHGHRLDVLPVALGNNKVRLDIRAKVSTGGRGPAAGEAEDTAAPTSETTSCETTVEMAYGETVLLSGLVSKRICAKEMQGKQVAELEDCQLLVVVTADKLPPRLLESVTKPHSASGP